MITKRESTSVPFRSVHYTAAGSMAKPPPQKWLIRGFAPNGWPTFIYGSRGAAKSYVATYLAMCVATGEDFLALPTMKTNVLYVDWESDEDAFHRRCLEISRGTGIGTIEDGKLVGVPALQCTKASEPWPRMVEELAHRVKDEDIDLVIIDSFSRAVRGSGMSLTQAAYFTYNLFRAKEPVLPCAAIIIDHIGNNVEPCYSPVLKSAWYVKACRAESSEQGHREPAMFLKLQHERHSFSTQQDDMHLRLRWDRAASAPNEYRLSIGGVSAETFRLEQPLDIIEKQILEYIRSVGRPCDTRELADALGFGVGPVKIRRATRSLVDKGRLVRVNIPDGAGPGTSMHGWDLAERQREEE